MEKWRLLCVSVALLGSGPVLAAGDSFFLEGELCFYDSLGNLQGGFVNPGSCATTFGWVDTVAGTGILQVWDEAVGDNDLWGDLTLFGEGTHTWSYVGYGLDGTWQTIDYTFTVGPGQVGGGMLFDYNALGDPYPFGVVNVWDVSDGCADFPWAYSCQTYTSTDWDGDGIPGGAVPTLPIPQINVSFDFYMSPVPLPAAVWLFAGGLAGLAGAARWRARA